MHMGHKNGKNRRQPAVFTKKERKNEKVIDILLPYQFIL